MRKMAAFLILALLIAAPVWAQVSDEIIEKTKHGVVVLYDSENPRYVRGSGFIIDAGGNVLTNYHVCENCPRLWARLYDGRKLELVKDFIWQQKDMAVWHPLPASIGGRPVFPYLNLSDSSWLAPDAPVASIGNSKYSVWQVIKGNFKEKYYFLKHQPTILYGFSGSPLINEEGYVVGLNVGSDNRDVSVTQEGFYASAIALDDVKEFLDYFYGRKTAKSKSSSDSELSTIDVFASKCVWVNTKEGRWCRHE